MKRNAKKTTKLAVEMNAAQAIIAAAQDIASERGDTFFPKVFISEVYARLAPLNPGLTISGFKALAMELHFADELTLSRCDLVEAHEASLVDGSAVEHDHETWHFVQAYR